MAMSRLEALIEAKQRGLAVSAQDEAVYQEATRRGLVGAPASEEPSFPRMLLNAATSTLFGQGLGGGGLGGGGTVEDIQDIGTTSQRLAGKTPEEAGPSGQPPTLGQAGAEMAGGTLGTIVGARGGVPGRALGAGAGTFVGGLATGRGLKDSFYDAFHSSLAEATGATVAPWLRGKIIPRVPEAARQTLTTPGTMGPTAQDIMGEAQQMPLVDPTKRNLELGEALQTEIKSELGGPRGSRFRPETGQGRIYETAGRLFEPVKQQAPPLDIQDLEARAQQLGFSLRPAEVGSEVERGTRGVIKDVYQGVSRERPDPTSAYARVDFDDSIRIRSRLLSMQRAYESKVPGLGDAIKAAAIGDLEHALETRMGQAARAGGVYDEWRGANQFFKTEYIERASKPIMREAMEASGEKIAPRLLRATVEDIRDLQAGTRRLSGETPEAMEAMKAGFVAHLFKASTNPANGVLNGRSLLTHLSAMDQNARELLLGQDLSHSLMQFGQAYSSGLGRLVFGTQAVGTGAIAGGLTSAVGGPAAGAAVETLNELTQLGRMIVARPGVARAMTAAVLTGKDDAVRRFGLTGTANTAGILRVIGTQALAQGSLQAEPEYAPNLRRAIEGAWGRLTRP